MQISKLKSKLNGGEEEEEENNAVAMESDFSVKEEEVSLPENITEEPPSSPPELLEHSDSFNYRSFTDLRDLLPLKAAASSFAAAGSSDSGDSSAVLNEESSSNVTVTPTAVPGGSFFQFVKMEQTEDHDDFLSGEEACGFFSDEQPPSLHWYSAVDHWT